MFFYITLVPKLQLPGTTEKPQLGGPVRGNNPWLGFSYSRDPQYLKDIKWFKNRVLYSFFFLNIPKVRSGYAIWWHFRFSDTFLQTRSNKFCTGKKKKILASDTVSLFISINICFKADPPQYDKNASLFSQQSYSSLPCFIHKQSESSPFIYGYVWNAPSYDKHVREQKYHPNPVQGGGNSATTHCSFQLWLVQHWIIYLHVPDTL